MREQAHFFAFFEIYKIIQLNFQDFADFRVILRNFLQIFSIFAKFCRFFSKFVIFCCKFHGILPELREMADNVDSQVEKTWKNHPEVPKWKLNLRKSPRNCRHKITDRASSKHTRANNTAPVTKQATRVDELRPQWCIDEKRASSVGKRGLGAVDNKFP